LRGEIACDYLRDEILDLRSILFIKEFLNRLDFKSNGITVRIPELSFLRVDILLWAGFSKEIGGLKGLTRSWVPGRLTMKGTLNISS
jgi:hypothetical protein